MATLLTLFGHAQTHRDRKGGKHQITLSGIITSIHITEFFHHFFLLLNLCAALARFKCTFIVQAQGARGDHANVSLCSAAVRHAIRTQDRSLPHSLALLIAA